MGGPLNKNALRTTPILCLINGPNITVLLIFCSFVHFIDSHSWGTVHLEKGYHNLLVTHPISTDTVDLGTVCTLCIYKNFMFDD